MSSSNLLGHVVSKSGIETNKKKIDTITNWPIPITVTNVRSFLGFNNYYRWFIPKYAHIAKSLRLLKSGENTSKKNKWHIRMRNASRLLTNSRSCVLNSGVVCEL